MAGGFISGHTLPRSCLAQGSSWSVSTPERTWPALPRAERRSGRNKSLSTTECWWSLPPRRSGKKPTLVGVSEGAGLSVLAATDPGTKTLIAGVIGLGLPDLNELGWRWRDSLIYLTHGVPNEPTFSAVAIVKNVAPLPLGAIHSSEDEFVPLSEVQRIIQGAGEPKKLWIVKASDHRFSDNQPEFDRCLMEAIAWVKQRTTR